VNDIASIGRVDLRAGTVDWTDFSHATVDGVGKLGELLRARGYRIPELPRSRETRPPGPWRALRILLGARGLARPRKLRWRTRRPVFQAPRHGFPWTVLTREETARLERAARARGVSVNAWLLARLSALLWPALLEEGERGPWLFPVNMRGVAGPLPDHANVASAILIDCGPGTDDRAIHAQVRARLAAGMHWATWWMLHVGRVVGRRGVRWISYRRERSAEYVGTFSNMGAWPPEGSAPGALDENEAGHAELPGQRGAHGLERSAVDHAEGAPERDGGPGAGRTRAGGAAASGDAGAGDFRDRVGRAARAGSTRERVLFAEDQVVERDLEVGRDATDVAQVAGRAARGPFEERGFRHSGLARQARDGDFAVGHQLVENPVEAGLCGLRSHTVLQAGTVVRALMRGRGASLAMRENRSSQ
jgi:hypothetical protein